MSTAEFEISYDGAALRDHAMDVEQLAPALMALGNLIREANAQINGDRSAVKVMVQSDFEHKCFNVGLVVSQTLIEYVRTLLQDDGVRSAHDILEWLGLLGVPTGIGGVFQLLRWLRGRKAKNVTELKDQTGKGDITIRAEGDGNQITVNQNVYNLAQNPAIRHAVQGVLAPLQSEGIDRVEFKEPTAATPAILINRDDAEAIRASCSEQPAESDDEVEHEPQPITAHLRVHSPVFDPKAEYWRFLYGDDIIYADITETTIAVDAIARGGVSVNDIYKVRMTITEHETPKGRFRKSYKIKEVLEFTSAPRTMSLFGTDDATSG